MNHSRMTFRPYNPLCVLIVLLLPIAALSKEPEKDGNIMRAAFLTTLEFAYEIKTLESTNGAGIEEGKLYSKIVQKTEAAYALALSVDDDFLKWVEPGLLKAFNKLRESLYKRAKGMRGSDYKLQHEAGSLWLEWGEYYNTHDKALDAKLKIN